MEIAGFLKNSFVDFPGKIAAVIFAAGCNYHCWYCHNHDLIETKSGNTLPEEVFEYLSRRSGKLDGVVFSGGEATLQKDLKAMMRRVKDMGFAVKLDTNGSNPAVVRGLIAEDLVDYIAMDIKAPMQKYTETVGCSIDERVLCESIALLQAGAVAYEFRTTVVPTLSQEDLLAIARQIAGARRWALQQYRKVAHAQAYESSNPHSPRFFLDAAESVRPYVQEVIVRGV